MNLLWLLLLAQVNVPSANVGLLCPVATVELSSQTPLYALEGQTLNVYFRNVVRYEGVWTDVTNVVTCAKGVATASAWTYTPAAGDAGTNSFTLTVKDKATGLTLAAKTVSLVTTALNSPASPVTRTLVLLGDSTLSGGGISAELVRLFSTDTQLTLVEAGTNGGTANDSLGNPRSVKSEGVSGASFAWFNTDAAYSWTTVGGVAKTGSAFVKSGAFDFNYYQTNNSITVVSGDWVIFDLGINAIVSSANDAALNSNIATELAALTNMVTRIQATVPGIRVGVAVTIPPNQSIAAFESDYGTGSTWIYRHLRNHQLFVENLIAKVESLGLPLVPIHANLNTATDLSNGVHPGESGYVKIAASIAAFLKGNE